MRQGFAQDTAIITPRILNIKPTTDFDQRFYYVPGERQNVWGYRAGVLINDKYKLGIGGYYMNLHASQGAPSGTTNDAVAINKKLYLGTVYYEPYLMRRTLWETSLVFETGYGRTVNTAVDKTGIIAPEKQNSLLIPAGVGLSVNLKLPPLFHVQAFRWVGINALAGYRLAVYRQDTQYSYNGAYWSLSGAVFLDRLFEDYQTWKKERAIRRDSRIIQLSF